MSLNIGSYDEPIIPIRVSSNELDYTRAKYQFPEAIQTLRKIPGRNYELNYRGYPTVGRITGKASIPDVKAYINELLGINQAMTFALRGDNRAGLRSEVRNFLFLNKDPRLKDPIPEIKETSKAKKEEKIEETQAEKEAQSKDEPLELGVDLDTSPEAYTLRKTLGQKRRDINEFYLKKEFIYPLAMLGILNSDHSYVTTLLSANHFGIKDQDRDVRLASVSILGELTKSIWLKYDSAKRHDLLPKSKADIFSPITIQSLEDDAASLETIINALTKQKEQGYGVFDSDLEVIDAAETVCNNAFKAQKAILRHIREVDYQIAS